MHFDLGEDSPMFCPLFNAMFGVNGAEYVRLALKFQNTVWAADMFQVLEREYQKMMEIEYSLHYDEKTR